MEKKKIKFESRYFDHGMEVVHRAQYNGDTLQDQYFVRFSAESEWSDGCLIVKENHHWSISADRALMREVAHFTPIKGIRSKIK